jgi:hypothetical protein
MAADDVDDRGFAGAGPGADDARRARHSIETSSNTKTPPKFIASRSM